MRASSLLVVSALAVSSCDGDHPLGVKQTGDPTVFSNIDVRIETSEYEFLDSSAANGPIGLGFGVNVYVNRGTHEGRVPELEVFIDGSAIHDVQRAIVLGEWDVSFQHYPKPAVRSQRPVVEFRYRGATTSLQTGSARGEITAPLTDEIVRASDPLIVRWSGESPKTVGLQPAWWFVELPAARLNLAGGGETTFVPKTPGEPNLPDLPKLPWTGDLAIEWSAETSPPSPFRSLTLQAGLRRLSRFQIR